MTSDDLTGSGGSDGARANRGPDDGEAYRACPQVVASAPPARALDRIDPLGRLMPFLKWPGGKGQELAAIGAAAPTLSARLIDPFVGGGSILLATPAEVPAEANDACRDLVELYVAAARGNLAFRQAVDGVAAAWDGLARLGQLYVELADAFEVGAADRTNQALATYAPALRSVLDQAGPGLASAVAARIARDLPAKFVRMRRLQARRGDQDQGKDRRRPEGEFHGPHDRSGAAGPATAPARSAEASAAVRGHPVEVARRPPR